MGKQKLARSDGRSADALVKQGGKAEKRLLRMERRAERSLTEARAKLRKAQMRLERRLSAVSDAEALLRTRQAARASGPHESNGTLSETLPPLDATATEQIGQASEPAKAVAESPVVPASKASASRTSASRTSASKTSASKTSATKSSAPSTPPPASRPPARRRPSRAAAPKEQGT